MGKHERTTSNATKIMSLGDLPDSSDEQAAEA
jgi:hypothetical protein